MGSPGSRSTSEKLKNLSFMRNGKPGGEIHRSQSKSSMKSQRTNRLHLADVYSPMMTPHFRDLPMPPLPVLSSPRNGFSPRRRSRNSPISAEMLKRFESLIRLRQKLGMEGLGEAMIQKLSLSPKILSKGLFSSKSENGRETLYRKSQLNDDMNIDRKSKYLSIMESANLKRSSPLKNLKLRRSILEAASWKDGQTPEISLNRSVPIKDRASLRDIGPLPATDPLKSHKSFLTALNKTQDKASTQIAEDVRGEENQDVSTVPMKKPERPVVFSPPLVPPKIKQSPRIHGHAPRGYLSKHKTSMRGRGRASHSKPMRGIHTSPRMNGRLGGIGRGIKVDHGSDGTSPPSRFPKRGEDIGVRGTRGRRSFRGGRPRISTEEQNSNVTDVDPG